MKVMKSFLQVIAPALVVSTAAFLVAAELHPAQPGGFTVHEWGTFTSVAALMTTWAACLLVIVEPTTTW